MAYTDSDTIKKILQVLPTTFPNVRNEEMVLNDSTKSYLQYNNVDTGTQKVKIIRTITSTIDSSITLNDLTFANLTPSLIVPKTVIVASDSTLSTIYIENLDYIVDYDEGKLKRATSTSSISNGQSVYVLSIPYTELTEGSDYDIGLTEGSIVRRAGTSIPDGATVYVDYSHSQVDVSDDLISETILQTDAIFDKMIKQANVSSSEKAINSAATNYCMYLICLSQAQKTLRLFRDESDNIGKIWLALGENYLKASEDFLSTYLYSPTFNPAETRINEEATFGNRASTRFGFRSGTAT